MSFNICALSGIIVENPVVSKNSGHIYEKRLIEKHIDATGRCPITKAELTKDDLLEIKVDKKLKPRLVSETSIPGLFTELQSEWDRLITETYNSRNELDATRKELAHILYQSDAATRVICNLLKERDLAREALVNYKSEFEEIDEEGLTGEEFENMGMYDELVERITELTFKLIADRKARKSTDAFLSYEKIAKYECKINSSPCISEKNNSNILNNPVGITCSDTHLYHSNLMIAGYEDGTCAYLDINPNEASINLKSLKKANNTTVNELEFFPSESYLAVGVCYDNNTASFFNINADGNLVEKYRIKSHMESMTGISFHPLQDYAIFSSLDGNWSFHNLLKGVCIHIEFTGSPIKTIKIHPDGGIFASGNSSGPGRIKLWDFSSQKPFLELKEDGMEFVNSLSFSENGYHLASCSEEDNVVRVWDIRKNSVVKYINLPENSFANKIKFDQSGNNLGIAGHVVAIYNTKNSELTNFESHKNICTSVNFERRRNEYIVSTSMDGDIKVFA